MKILIILILLTSCSKSYNCIKYKTPIGHPITTFNRTEFVKDFPSLKDVSKEYKEKDRYWIVKYKVECL